MSLFGDLELADVFDTAPPAPDQVAYRIHRIRRYLDRLAGTDPGDFFDMTRREQDRAFDVADDIVTWVADHAPTLRADLPRAVHEFYFALDPSVPAWDDLAPDLVTVAEAIARELADWLIRQGAWR